MWEVEVSPAMVAHELAERGPHIHMPTRIETDESRRRRHRRLWLRSLCPYSVGSDVHVVQQRIRRH